jgi:nephrocystin-4
MLENIVPDEPIKPRSVHILFNNQHNRTVSVVELQVYPQPFVVDKTFHFYNAENDFLKKSIRMRTRYSVFNSSNANKYIHCSSNNVIANSIVSSDPAELQAVTIKYRCGAGPQVTRLYLLLYNDPFKISLLETWQIFVHSLQRIDLVGIAGQTTKSPLILRGGVNSRVIQCYSSNTDELTVRSCTYR